MTDPHDAQGWVASGGVLSLLTDLEAEGYTGAALVVGGLRCRLAGGLLQVVDADLAEGVRLLFSSTKPPARWAALDGDTRDVAALLELVFPRLPSFAADTVSVGFESEPASDLLETIH